MASQLKAIHPHLPRVEAKMVHTRECLRSSQIMYVLNRWRDVTEQERMEFMALTRLAEMLSMREEHLASIFHSFHSALPSLSPGKSCVYNYSPHNQSKIDFDFGNNGILKNTPQSRIPYNICAHYDNLNWLGWQSRTHTSSWCLPGTLHSLF
jgi:hypothetical protein